jgi:uncharacterized protein
MKQTLWILLALALILTGCKEKLTEETTATWPDGKPQKVTSYRINGDKKVKVSEIRYYQNGQKEMEGTFVNDKKDGAWTCWFENGKKQSEGFFKNDLRDGKAVVWRESGFKYYEGTYSMGKLHGTWVFYDTGGRRLSETVYEYGKKVHEVNFEQNPQ